jgi:hypothetical protein
MVAAGRVGYGAIHDRRRLWCLRRFVSLLVSLSPVFDRRKASTKELGFPPIVRILSNGPGSTAARTLGSFGGTFGEQRTIPRNGTIHRMTQL